MRLLSQLFKSRPNLPEPSEEYLKMLELAKEFENIVLNWMDSYCYYMNIDRYTVIDDKTGRETYQVYADENDNPRAHPDLIAEIYVNDKNRVIVYVEVKSKKSPYYNLTGNIPEDKISKTEECFIIEQSQFNSYLHLARMKKSKVDILFIISNSWKWYRLDVENLNKIKTSIVNPFGNNGDNQQGLYYVWRLRDLKEIKDRPERLELLRCGDKFGQIPPFEDR